MSKSIKILLIIIIAIFILFLGGVYYFLTYQNPEEPMPHIKPIEKLPHELTPEEIDEIHKVIWEVRKAKCMAFLSQNKEEYVNLINSLYFPEEAERIIKRDWPESPYSLTNCEVLDIEFGKIIRPKELPDRIFFTITAKIKRIYENGKVLIDPGYVFYFLKKDEKGKWKIEIDQSADVPPGAVKSTIQQLKEKDKQQK